MHFMYAAKTKAMISCAGTCITADLSQIRHSMSLFSHMQIIDFLMQATKSEIKTFFSAEFDGSCN